MKQQLRLALEQIQGWAKAKAEVEAKALEWLLSSRSCQNEQAPLGKILEWMNDFNFYNLFFLDTMNEIYLAGINVGLKKEPRKLVSFLLASTVQLKKLHFRILCLALLKNSHLENLVLPTKKQPIVSTVAAAAATATTYTYLVWLDTRLVRLARLSIKSNKQPREVFFLSQVEPESRRLARGFPRHCCGHVCCLRMEFWLFFPLPQLRAGKCVAQVASMLFIWNVS